MRLSPGSVLGPYEISAAIGAGGMGEVYRARDPRLHREVALKVLPRDVTGDPQRLARFEREARSSSALNHPNIITIHEFVADGEHAYLVMELIRGESLRALISRGPVTLKRLFAIASGIADGLAAAHGAGIIHRDLKPENVMLTADGVPKILDFGLARAAADSTPSDSPTEVRLTGTGMVLGTQPYMAPEQARGESVGIQCDQFALGLMLYEMATGRHPFRRSNNYETVTAILREDAPPLGDQFPEPFIWIVERCLAKDPRERYAATADLAHDLTSLRDRASGSRKSIQLGTVQTPAVMPPQRSAWVPAVAAIVVLLLAAAALWGPSRRDAATPTVDVPMQVDLVFPGLDVLRGESAVPTVLSPDGRWLVTQASGSRGPNELWLRDLHSGEMRMLVDDAFGPAWSSDSASIAYFSDGKLKTMRIAGGPAQEVCDARPEGTPSWHGDTILFVQYSVGPAEPGLFRVSASGGEPEVVIRFEASEGGTRLPWWPAFLPDGKRFLYMDLVGGPGRNRIDHELKLGFLDGSPSRLIGRIDSRAVFVDGHLLYVRDGTLLAHPFDPEEARFAGDARPIVSGLHYFRSTGGAAFSVSETGLLVWRRALPPSRLAWVDRAGVELQTIDTASFDTAGRLSRDALRYAVGVIDPRQGISDVWVYDLERESAERRTSDLLDQKAPVWAADQRTLYYRTDGYGGPPDIFALRPGEQNPAPVHRGPSVEHPEDVSPDGKWLLFTTFLPLSADIHVLPLDPPGPPRDFVVTRFNEVSPRFSPDGRWVAYSSNLSGRSEIYARPFDGSLPTVRVSRDGGAQPRWSGDGRELFFFGPAGRMMTVPFDGTFGQPRMLFQEPSALSFETGPDPNRFLVHLSGDEGAAPIQMLIHWQGRR